MGNKGKLEKGGRAWIMEAGQAWDLAGLRPQVSLAVGSKVEGAGRPARQLYNKE